MISGPFFWSIFVRIHQIPFVNFHWIHFSVFMERNKETVRQKFRVVFRWLGLAVIKNEIKLKHKEKTILKQLIQSLGVLLSLQRYFFKKGKYR